MERVLRLKRLKLFRNGMKFYFPILHFLSKQKELHYVKYGCLILEPKEHWKEFLRGRLVEEVPFETVDLELPFYLIYILCFWNSCFTLIIRDD